MGKETEKRDEDEAELLMRYAADSLQQYASAVSRHRAKLTEYADVLHQCEGLAKLRLEAHARMHKAMSDIGFVHKP